MKAINYSLILGVTAALALSGCGDSQKVASGDVAEVNGKGISQITFKRLFKLAAGEQNAQQRNPGAVIIPDPPQYQSCIEAQIKQSKLNPRKADRVELKENCEKQYQALKSQVMTFLIRSEWLDQQAQQLGIEIPPSKVKAEFDKLRKQNFPDSQDYQAYLKNSGQTEADLLYRQKSQMLEERITEQVTKQAGKVAPGEIEAYYKKNRSQFTEPAIRSLNVVLTKTQAEAEKAKQLIEQGESWEKVANRYSIDPTSKSNGGILAGVSQGSQERNFDKAVFQAPKGKLEGPLKTSLGFYVFQVTSETPEKIQSLEKSQEAITQIVISEHQQKALEAFGKTYQAKWRAKTLCAEEYLVRDCRNWQSGQQSGDRIKLN